jgi:hypothetical protein
VSRERVPVSDEKEAVKFLLQFYPVFQHTMVMPEVQSTCRPHAGQHPALISDTDQADLLDSE